MLNLFRCPIDGSRFKDKWICENGHSFTEIDGIIDFMNDEKVENPDILEKVAGVYEQLWAPIGMFLTSGGKTYSSIMRSTGEYVSGNLVIDIGTGTGKLFDYTKCEVCIGIDISTKFLRILKRKRSNVIAVRANANRLPFNNEIADGISAMFVLHMIPSKAVVLNEIFRVLKGKGKFVSSVLTNNNSFSRFLAKWWKLELFSVDYYVKLLKEVGFEKIEYQKIGAWTLFKCAKP
ncbi:class I SAM-dependent methyltransferase [Stygiolobus azoricus]|uniref:Methyltransferase domain-containing protein n=1 Tax=Stygiolobus azoricus TaxID=41675 RepID=A0A650CQY1_9CREN|nr:class I SAM-dependent methyltransferase [Stygiolobus azoricus]QGR20239.1 methyltransferase domain-containing protein [Stygiolobus azoricus]